MKHRIKQEKGITMTALVITVIILLILTSMLIYNAQDSIHISRLTNLYNDIELLREKVSAYYNEYGKIPAEIIYTNETQLQNLSSVLSTNNDTGDFYVIDLEAMQGITLNYGKDYENVKNEQENANYYTDLYIINENSHNIFYVKGISITEYNETKTYYTDYIEPDETTIDLRYVDKILIPDGCYYIGKTPDGSIVISTTPGEKIGANSENQYTWTKQISELEKIPDSVKLKDNQIEYQFIKSVNTYKGYFKNSIENVKYVVIDEEKWSEAYTKEMEYEDRNGDKVTIPEGFRISMSPTMNTVENGFVVKDSNDNEWVWIVVPTSIYGDKVTNATDYEGIYNALNTYASTYREGNLGQGRYWKDEWYYWVDSSTTLYGYVEKTISNQTEYDKAVSDGNLYINKAGIEATSGRYNSSNTYYERNKSLTEAQKTNTTNNSRLSLDDYATYYKKMLSSIYTNGGFWISRYEAGIAETNTDTTNETISPERFSHNAITSTSPKAVSQANRIPYNWVSCSEAQSLASAMSADSSKTSKTSKTSSLLFGIQWDLVCKYLEVNAFYGTSSYLNSDSTSWGNYKNSSLTLKDKSRYCTSPSSPSPNGAWSLYTVTGNFVQKTDKLYKTNSNSTYYGLLTTGASENANKMNIYDFAGNEWEWTLEHATSNTSNPCAGRGGVFNGGGSDIPASNRSDGTTGSNHNIGFRSTLY